MKIVSNEDKRIKDIAEINKICAENNTPMFVLGVTLTGEKIVRYLKDNGLSAEVLFTVDDEYFTEEQKSRGIIPFSEYLSNYKDSSPLVFGFFNYKIIMEKREKYKEVIPFMFDFHITVVNGVRVNWSLDYVYEHMDEYLKTYDMLSDDRSRETMQAFLNAAAAGDFHNLFANYFDEIPYFNEKILGRKIDFFFDCGAFDGDSAHDFVKVINNYKHIYEFEPDASNVERINARVRDERIRDLSIIEKGVWSETTTLRFASEGKSASSVSDEGDVSIDVIKLDDMYDMFTPNSLIKMDIEGSEMEALKGASRIIREISPAILVSIYHKRDDLITIPQFINSLVSPGVYDYYIGFQGLDLAELVFYALPHKK